MSNHPQVETTTQKTQLYQKEGYQGQEAIYHHETDYPSVRRDEILFSVTDKGMLLVSKLNGETMCMVTGPTLEDLEKMIACARGADTDLPQYDTPEAEYPLEEKYGK